jgi:hypothetical protein
MYIVQRQYMQGYMIILSPEQHLRTLPYSTINCQPEFHRSSIWLVPNFQGGSTYLRDVLSQLRIL